MFDIGVLSSSLTEAPSHCEGHQTLASERDIQGKSVHIMLCLGQLCQEGHNTKSPSSKQIMSLLFIVNLHQVPAFRDICREQIMPPVC